MLFRCRNNIHFIRTLFGSRPAYGTRSSDVKPITTGSNAASARAAFDELADKWGQPTLR